MLNNKIKIIHIIPTLSIGGAERFLVDLAIYTDKDKFDIKIICLKELGILSDELINNNIDVISVGKKNKPVILSVFKLRKILKKEKPNIVHTHLFGGVVYGSIVAKLVGVKKVIATEQNINIAEGYFKKLIKKMVVNFIDNYIAVSMAVADYIKKTEGVPAEKIKVIHNGVVVNKFLHQTRNYDNAITIGSVGRLVSQKGYEILIRAMKRIEDCNVKCLISGTGLLKLELEKQIKDLNLSDRIKLVGVKNDVSSFLKQIDIFVMPSHWEGLGIVLLEAGLNGLPVIASDVDGIQDIISSDCGLLVQPDDDYELAEKINFLIKDSNIRKQLGSNLQAKVKQNFSIESIVKQYEEIYLQQIYVK